MHRNDDTDLADLEVRDASGHESTIHTTQHHKFWSDTTGNWVEAEDLAVGERLHDLGTSTVSVIDVRTYDGLQTMYDLTIEGVHTYYVVAGNESILVHNCGEFSQHALDQMAERGVTMEQAETTLQQPVGSYWHDGMWKEGFYDPISKIFVGRGPDGGVTTVITNASRGYVERLLEAAP